MSDEVVVEIVESQVVEVLLSEGPRGLQGVQGATGLTGADSTVVGPQGVQGETGPAVDTTTLSVEQAQVTGLGSDLALKAPLISPSFVGVVGADNYDVVVNTLSSDSFALNFSGGAGIDYRATVAGAVTVTASGYRVGATKTVVFTNGVTVRALTFPAAWIFVGAKPATLAASKTGILTVTSLGWSEEQCVAGWVAQA
jgi:hypothetical protein